MTSITATQLKRSRYLRAAGHRATCPPDRAGRHIHALRMAGMIDSEIRAAAHVGLATFYRAAALQGPIMRTTEQRILAVVTSTPGRPRAGRADVPPHGTRRRLQGLVFVGWPPPVLAAALGMRLQQVHGLLNRERDGVAVRTAGRVEALFAELWDQRPEEHGVRHAAAVRARALAYGHGWAPPAVWDDLDDPYAVPQWGADTSRVQAVVEDTAELVREGLSREGIAARLGIQWDAVRQAHRRAGVDLPEVQW
jgi:hypothetical protein